MITGRTFTDKRCGRRARRRVMRLREKIPVQSGSPQQRVVVEQLIPGVTTRPSHRMADCRGLS